MFIRSLLNKEQRRSLMALEAGTDEPRNWIGGQAACSQDRVWKKGECMNDSAGHSRQLASHLLVVVEPADPY